MNVAESTEEQTGLPSAKKNETERSLSILIALLWFGLLAVHANKALGYYPLVIPDEYYYTNDLRHLSYDQVFLPGYIYYAVYSVTSWFGQAYFDAGRVLNALLFMLSAPFLYSVSRLVCSKRLSLFVTFLVLVSPLSTYTIYFMPESIYFLGFWALFWFIAVKSVDMPPIPRAALAGAGIAIASLLKYHGIFLLPGLLLYIFVASPRENLRDYAKTAGLACLAGIVAFFVVRLGIGFLFAGSEGLKLTARHYEGVSEKGTTGIEYATLFQYLLYSLRGHLTGLAILFGPALAMGLAFAAGGGTEKKDPLKRVVLLALCFYVPLLLVTVGFSSMLTLWQELSALAEIKRITWRYYNFLFPVFPILTAGLIQRLPSSGRIPRVSAIMIHGILALFVTLILIRGFRGYIFYTSADCPELGGLLFFPPIYNIALALVVLMIIVGLFQPHLAAKGYLFAVLPFMYLAATGLAQVQIMGSYGALPDVYDRGGIFAREQLGDECSQLTVIDVMRNRGHKALIHIDDPNADLMVNTTPDVHMGMLKPGKKWLLVFGDLRVPQRKIKSKVDYEYFEPIPPLTLFGDSTQQRQVKYSLVRIAD